MSEHFIQWIRSRYAGVCVSDRSSGLSTWKVRSMTVVHCRQRMMNVLGLGRSVFISWHSGHIRGKPHQRHGQREKWLQQSFIFIWELSSTTLHTLSRERRTGALRFTPHTLTRKPYTHFSNSCTLKGKIWAKTEAKTYWQHATENPFHSALRKSGKETSIRL